MLVSVELQILPKNAESLCVARLKLPIGSQELGDLLLLLLVDPLLDLGYVIPSDDDHISV